MISDHSEANSTKSQNNTHFPTSGGGEKPEVRILIHHGQAIKSFYRNHSQEKASELYHQFALQLIRGQIRIDQPSENNIRSRIQTQATQFLIQHLTQTGELEEQVNKLQSSFYLSWRQSLLEAAWRQLKSIQESNGKRFFTVLKARVDMPDLSNDELYQFMMESGEAVSGPSAFRECLQKARAKFAKILFAEVLATLDSPTDCQVKSELQLLGLHHFFPSDSFRTSQAASG